MTPSETVQTIYAAFGRGDVPAIIDLVADDVEWESWGGAIATRKHIAAAGVVG